MGTEKGEEKRATSSGAQVCPKPAHLPPSDSHKVGIRTPTADEEGIQFSSLVDLSFHTLQSKRREPILVLGDQVAKAQDQR